MLRSFGKYSYAIYLVNGLVVESVVRRFAPSDAKGFVSPEAIVTPLNFVAFTALAVVITYVIALVSWHVFEKQWGSCSEGFNALRPDLIGRRLCFYVSRDSSLIRAR